LKAVYTTKAEPAELQLAKKPKPMFIIFVKGKVDDGVKGFCAVLLSGWYA